MGAGYHQFCPVAKAMELLDERWTMLIVRELASGSERFTELRNGLPRISPTLLSRRLQHLERAGVLTRHEDDDGVRYRLTTAGRELRPILESLGAWGVRWIGELGDRDLDPKLLLWDMRRNVRHDALPAGRTVLRFDFSDVARGGRRWWLVLSPADADVCDLDPGYDVDVTVHAHLRAMVDVWLGDRTWSDTLKTGEVRFEGPESLRRAVPDWFLLSAFAAVPRTGAVQPSTVGA
jgi:DNA-binding HxlR family transcriptional regulator